MGFVNPKDQTEKLFMVLFGAPGVGKTVLSQKIGGKTLIITDEAGHKALRTWPEFDGLYEVWVYEDIRDIDALIAQRKAGKLKFDTMIFDTFTGIQKFTLKQHMTPGYHNFLTTNRNHPNVPALQDYLLSEQLWTPVLQKLAVQTDFNVILNCHVRLPDSDPAKRTPGDKVRPSLPDAVYQVANGKANLVVYMDTMGGDEKSSKQVGLGERTPISRFVSTVATNKVAGKNQIRGLPPVMTDDDFVKAVLQWQGQST
jgi:hypothetical protein